ncbi:hypothetical protein PVAP13_7KG176555 [Panicum virgatum]|uniref:Uncharacterized protein n=1 Tax=Panicum virgatum TaxID=38727 RepID=A0A8T0QMS6_PANVG|nr:hypothetical protein PVAP13_7KG176555 [Panicum virgatum]
MSLSAAISPPIRRWARCRRYATGWVTAGGRARRSVEMSLSAAISPPIRRWARCRRYATGWVAAGPAVAWPASRQSSFFTSSFPPDLKIKSSNAETRIHLSSLSEDDGVAARTAGRPALSATLRREIAAVCLPPYPWHH